MSLNNSIIMHDRFFAREIRNFLAVDVQNMECLF